MTRFLALLSCLILVLGLCIGVSAADTTRAYSVNILATVSGNGSCEVTNTVTLHITSPQESLIYPIPVSASNVTLNGSPTFTEKTEQARLVDLSNILGNMTGDFSFTVTYSIHSVISPLVLEDAENAEKQMRVELPLLAGFAYPIDQLQFSINFPNNVTRNPSFVSGYHQANIEKDLTHSHSGNNVAGRSWNALKDHETLTMYLDTSADMFPQTRMELPDVETVSKLITVCSVIALLFWLLFLRNFLPLQTFPAVAPEGFGAGQMGTILTMAGADLSLMVFSWAQLGYVSLRLDRKGRILILKQMEMGNERTAFEQKCFKHLFGRRDVVDTSTSAYSRMCHTVALQKPARQLFLSKGSAGIAVFRILMALVGLLSGTCFGIILGNMLDYGWLFMMILSTLGLVCSWHIQAWPQGFFLHLRSRLWISVILCLLWLVLGMVMNQFSMALFAVFLQIAAGFLAAFGGRRTEEGRMDMGQVLSLRRYLCRLTPQQTQQMRQANPEAFFDLAPYAMALGCDRAFARRFGKAPLPICPYIQAGKVSGLSALQWSQLMHHILTVMTVKQRKLPLENFRAAIRRNMR